MRPTRSTTREVPRADSACAEPQLPSQVSQLELELAHVAPLRAAAELLERARVGLGAREREHRDRVARRRTQREPRLELDDRATRAHVRARTQPSRLPARCLRPARARALAELKVSGALLSSSARAARRRRLPPRRARARSARSRRRTARLKVRFQRPWPRSRSERAAAVVGRGAERAERDLGRVRAIRRRPPAEGGARAHGAAQRADEHAARARARARACAAARARPRRARTSRPRPPRRLRRHRRRLITGRACAATRPRRRPRPRVGVARLVGVGPPPRTAARARPPRGLLARGRGPRPRAAARARRSRARSRALRPRAGCRGERAQHR